MPDTNAEILRSRIDDSSPLAWKLFGNAVAEVGIWHMYEWPKIGTMEFRDGTRVFFQEVHEYGDLSIWKYTQLDYDFYEQHVVSAVFPNIEGMRTWIKEMIDGSPDNIWALADDLYVMTTWL